MVFMRKIFGSYSLASKLTLETETVFQTSGERFPAHGSILEVENE